MLIWVRIELLAVLTSALFLRSRNAWAHTPRELLSSGSQEATSGLPKAVAFVTDLGLGQLMTLWAWRPEVLLVLVLLGALYVVGWRRLRQRSAASHGQIRHLALYLTGLVLLGCALFSPLDTLTALLFSVHMIQHVLLTMLVPPLLLLANPFPVMLWGMPRTIRHGLGRVLAHRRWLRGILWGLTLPPVAWLLHTLTLWGWHHPAAYQMALRNDLMHDVEHLAFFLTGLLFWYPMINPAPRLHGHIAYGWRLLYVIVAAVQNTVLAALLTLTDRVWYPHYLSVPRLWDWTAIHDQVTGGVIMWSSGSMMYLVAMFLLLVIMLPGSAAAEATKRP